MFSHLCFTGGPLVQNKLSITLPEPFILKPSLSNWKFLLVFGLSTLILAPWLGKAAGADGVKPSSKPAGSASSSATATTTSKPNLNANIYEKQAAVSNFTDVVKFIRELDGQPEVVFGKFGTYTAPDDGAAIEKLNKSLKKKLPVDIVFDEVTLKILKVNLNEETDK
jgi:hypothetical protein